METNDPSISPPPDDDLKETVSESASEPDTQPDDTPNEISEDDPQLLGSGTRILDDADSGSDTSPIRAEPNDKADRIAADGDGTSDAGSIQDEPVDSSATSERADSRAWIAQDLAHNVALELKRIETEVRSLLQDRDPQRKRKLAGSKRWLDLEDDLIQWRFAGRIDEPTLRRLQEMVSYRHHLFRQLRFLAFTRPVWNS